MPQVVQSSSADVARIGRAGLGWLALVAVIASAVMFAGLRFVAAEFLVDKVLHVDTCASAGINIRMGRQGRCTVGARLFGPQTTFVVVDAGRTLQMPGYAVRLLATRSGLSSFRPGSRYPNRLYPGGRAVLFSFQVAVTNDGARALRFDPASQAITIGLPVSSSSLDQEYLS